LYPLLFCLFSAGLLHGCVYETELAVAPEVEANPTSLANVTFPLQLSSNGRHLVDSHGQPFLIKEISAWGLIQAVSETDAGEFMDAVKAMGFNTLLVSVISYDQRFAGLPPTWRLNSPFGTRWDFSTYSPVYFKHVDRVLKAAESRGLLVALVPCYLGYPDDVTQGWAAALQHAANTPAKSRAFGRFLGQRYRSFSNIIWVAGGDNSGSGPVKEHLTNIIEGIREFDTHYWTGHFDAASGDVWSTDNTNFGQYIDLDGLYAWTEAELGSRGPQYKAALSQYKKGKMIFQLDQSYENDAPLFADNTDPQWIRRKNYDGLLSGCAGTSFSPGARDNQLYTFANWRPLMTTQGMREASLAFRLFESRPWNSLVPDDQNAAVVDGRGTFGAVDYVCAARSEHGDTVIAYLPSSRTVTIDMSKIAGSMATAWWFDPSKGSARRIGLYVTSGIQQFTPPSERDWVLVIDNAAKGYLPPGLRPLAAPTM
jgi:hypothetical protein